MEKTLVLFDLDGTIIDPKAGITRSIQYALGKMGRHVPETDELLPFIGPPLREMFVETYGFSKAEVDEAIAQYRVYFGETGMYECVLYPGIAPMLKELRDMGKTLMIATSKPQFYAEKIAEHIGVLPYFSFVAGDTMENTRSKKSAVIHYALQQAPGAAPQQAIMVGDREHDIFGAKACGIACVGVEYGYGGKEELAAAGADYIAENTPQLAALLKGL